MAYEPLAEAWVVQVSVKVPDDGTLKTNDNPGTTEFQQRADHYKAGDFSVNGKDDDVRKAVTAYYKTNPGSTADVAKPELQKALGNDPETVASIDNLVIQSSANFDDTRITGSPNGTGANSTTAQLDGASPLEPSPSVADPVDLVTGQFVHSAVDITVSGAGMDFVFERTYRSGAFYFGPLGVNWDHAYNLWLRVNTDDSVSVTSGRLREVRYHQHQTYSDCYLAIGEDGIVRDYLRQRFELQSANGRVVRFEQVAGDIDSTIYRVSRIKDRFGNALAFHYDAQARLSEVQVNHRMRKVAFAYDDLSRVASITLFPVTYWTGGGSASVQRRWTYRYDDFSDLVAVTGPPTDEFPAGRTTKYSYSSPASLAQRQHDLLGITDPNGATYLENEFGNAAGTVAFGRVVRQRLGSGVFLFEYSQVIPDPSWSLSDSDRPTSCVTVVQRDGHPVRYVLNTLGNILASEETILDGGERTVIWRYAYDGDGRRTATVSPEGRVSQIYYGREDFYRRTMSPGDPSLLMWQDPRLSASEHARFGNIIAAVKRGAKLTLPGFLDDLAIYGDVFPDLINIHDPDDVIVKTSYEGTFQQLASVSDPRYTDSPDPAAAETLDPSSPYSRHLTVTTFNGDAAATPAAIRFPDTTYPAPLPNGSTGVVGAQRTFDAYDANGRLLHWTEPEGNAFTREYFAANSAKPTTEGFLAASTAGVGTLDLRTVFAVNEAGQVRAVSDPLGNTTQYTIDPSSLVRSVAQPINGYEVGYKYDGNGQLISRTTAIIDPDGSVAAESPELETFAYNEESKAVRATIGDSSGTPPRRIVQIYDSSNRLVRAVKPRGNSTCYEYDERSLLKQGTRGCCGPEASTTAYGYDLDELGIAVIDPRGSVTSTKLDALGRPVETVDAGGNRQRTRYDKRNNPLIQWRLGATLNGTYPLLRRTEYLYDERGQLIRTRRAFFREPIPTSDPWSGPDTEFTAAVLAGKIEWYDTLIFRDGNLRSFRLVDALGNASTAKYDDADGRIVATDPMGNVTRTTYDAASNVVRKDRNLVDSSGVIRAVLSTAFDYDPLNRLKAATDGAGNRTAFGLDSRGLVRTVTNPLGHTTTQRYSGFRELEATTQPLLDSGGAVVPLTTALTHDPNGNLDGITDPTGNLTQFVYDSLDRRVRTINPDGSSRSLAYDRSSNLIKSVDEEGLEVSADFDCLDQLVLQVIQPPGPSPISADLSAKFSYDGAGRLISHSNSFLSVAKSCDSLGRCYDEMLEFGPQLRAPASPLSLTRQFDGVSNRIAVGYPSGQKLTYGFDRDSQLSQLKSVAAASGYPGDPTAPPIRGILERQRWGDLPISCAFGNSVTMSSDYDAAGRRVADLCNLANGQQFALQQLWDGTGNRALTMESYAGIVTGWHHDYDSINRLIDSVNVAATQELSVARLAPPTTPLPVTSWTCQQTIDAILSGYSSHGPPQLVYDATGNRVSYGASGGMVDYRVNVRNEYTSVAGTSCAYDRAGRLVDDGKFTLAYNFRGQLVRATEQTNGSVVLQVFHDATGRPVGIIEDSQTRVVVLDGANPIELYDNGVLTALYLWEAQERLCFFASSGEDHYVFRDVVGSTRITTDSAGALSGTYQYDAFGSLVAGALATPILFSGKYLYESIGWYDYQTRQYVPRLGRFAQPDSAGFIDGSNLYTFVGNNPLSATDPNGTSRQGIPRAAFSLPGGDEYMKERAQANLDWAIHNTFKNDREVMRTPLTFPFSLFQDPPADQTPLLPAHKEFELLGLSPAQEGAVRKFVKDSAVSQKEARQEGLAIGAFFSAAMWLAGALEAPLLGGVEGPAIGGIEGGLESAQALEARGVRAAVDAAAHPSVPGAVNSQGQLALPFPGSPGRWGGGADPMFAFNTSADMMVGARSFGGSSGVEGAWVSPFPMRTTLEAKEFNVIGPWSSAEGQARVFIPKGTRIQVGIGRPGGSFPGGEPQWLLLDKLPGKNFGPGGALPPY